MRAILCSLMAVIFLSACQQIRSASTAQGKESSTGDADIREAFAAMARAHEQKTELAFYEAFPWNNTGAPFHEFYVDMGKAHAELLKELQAAARQNGVDLKFSYSNDAPGRAQKIMEARQEKVVRGDARADFTRDTLMQMYTDYEWQISLIQAATPTVHQPALAAYLRHSLKVHEEGSAQLTALLKKFQPAH